MAVEPQSTIHAVYRDQGLLLNPRPRLIVPMDFSDYLPFVHMSVLFLVLLPALLLDAALGDPPGWPHPVRLLGALCLRAEALTRRGIGHEGLAGLVAVALVLGCTALGLGLLLSLPGIVALPLAIYLGFSGLALGQLLREGQAAKALLEQGEVAAARAAIAMLVSRDLTQADEADLCRALGETLAENFNDAFVAPLFWFVLAGPLGLWLYKAASTMDSMWGYPYPPWTRFGTAAARLDDALAYVPARLSALLLYLARKRNAMFWPWPACSCPRGHGHEKPQRRLAHGRLCLALRGKHGWSNPVCRRTGAQTRPWPSGQTLEPGRAWQSFEVAGPGRISGRTPGHGNTCACAYFSGLNPASCRCSPPLHP